MTLALDETTLHRLAGDVVFERGRAYFAEGRVLWVRTLADSIHATVRGADDYEVSILSDKESIHFACVCHAAGSVDVCKHSVAAGLAFINGGQESVTPPARKTAPKRSVPSKKQSLNQFIKSLPAGELADIVLVEAEVNREFRRLLELRMAAAGSGADIRPMRAALKKAILHTRFIDYYESDAYFAKVHTVIDQLEAMLDRGQAESVISLCEYGLEVWEKGWDAGIDDSNGGMGEIKDQLSDVHLEACRRYRPNSVDLARRLFNIAIQSEWEVFLTAATDYADVLGAQGLQEYLRLAEEVWKTVPTLGPENKDDPYDGSRFVVTHIMEKIVTQVGDIEQLVEVMQRNLSSPFHFERIADVYAEAGQMVPAIEWVERGIAAFPDQGRSQLSNRLAELYEESGRHDDAIGLLWESFVAQPDLEQFQLLKAHAEGGAEWPGLRERSLDHMRGLVGSGPRPLRPGLGSAHFDKQPSSTLVEIFLWEGVDEAAWQVAMAHGCHRQLWLRVAERRALTHPLDAIPIYEQEVEELIDQRNRQGYQMAVSTLVTLRSLAVQAGCPQRFETYLGEVAEKHRAKRSLIGLLMAQFP
jgi:uncharacterized Zn finger protein